MRLFEIRVRTSDVEIVTDRCWQAGASGVWERDRGRGPTSLCVGVPDDVVDEFLAWMHPLDPVDVTDREAVELATRTIDLGPPGARVTLTVPPTVFGDGRHPTTAACLAALLDLVATGTTVLDVGCGSGVLSVVAARLGGIVTAIDIDTAAVAATSENATANGVAVAASAVPLAEVGGSYDLVMANISADRLVELAGEIKAHIAPDGTGLVSGILENRWPQVRESLGLAVRSRTVDDGWVTAVVDRSIELG